MSATVLAIASFVGAVLTFFMFFDEQASWEQFFALLIGTAVLAALSKLVFIAENVERMVINIHNRNN